MLRGTLPKVVRWLNLSTRESFSAIPGTRPLSSVPQRPLDKSNSLAVYVHWPYCESKCTYCAFNKYHIPKSGQDHDRMEMALLSELQHALKYPVETHSPGWRESNHMEVQGSSSSNVTKSIRSIYFGGGTPSLARPDMVRSIVDYLERESSLEPNVEITLEVNPTSSEVGKLEEFRSAGINRLSMGIQALDNAALRAFGRDHSVLEAIEAARKATSLFSNVSFDFIWGRERQSVKEWEQELRMAASLGATHLSLYHLTVERGTPLFKNVEKGQVALPDNDLAGQLYERTVQVTAEEGYEQYEVSSFAKNGNPEFRSKHNSSYWDGLDYIGIGPGAHGRVWGHADSRRFRTFRILDPETWKRSCEEIGHGMRKVVPIPELEAAQEMIMLRLRTLDGLSFHQLKEQGINVDLENVMDWTMVQIFIQSGLLEYLPGSDANNPNGVRPTKKGLAVIDGILAQILK
ncbi:hypothetical protein DFS34DRAFT_696969 [Phlyctochytrium arcticum]|nr:hypothetical protein DFS34DRAFT_696969 [Phlyctochytrium arcticum]